MGGRKTELQKDKKFEILQSIQKMEDCENVEKNCAETSNIIML